MTGGASNGLRGKTNGASENPQIVNENRGVRTKDRFGRRRTKCVINTKMSVPGQCLERGTTEEPEPGKSIKDRILWLIERAFGAK